MHQVASPTLTPRKKRFRRKRYIIFGAIGLLLLWIVVASIMGKREKPIPVTTEKSSLRFPAEFSPWPRRSEIGRAHV